MTVRPRVLLSSAIAATLLVAGCSGTGSSNTDPAVEGAPGEDPTMTFSSETAPTELTVEVIEEGDGPEVGADDFVLANYEGQVWNGDVFDSSFERGAPALFSLNQVIAGWKEGLTGVKEGSRVLLSVPPALGYGEQGNEQAGIGGEDTITFVVDVLGTFAPDAAGDPDATPTDEELPVTITGDLGSPATVAPAEGAEPPADAPQVITVAEGTSDTVVPEASDGAMVVLQYAATTWDGANSESTWDMQTPVAISLGGTVFDGLAGLPVGSRAVVLVPGQVDPTTGQEVPAMAAVADILGTAQVQAQPAPAGSPTTGR